VKISELVTRSIYATEYYSESFVIHRSIVDVLVLTNQVETFNNAVQSRINLPLQFKDLGELLAVSHPSPDLAVKRSTIRTFDG